MGSHAIMASKIGQSTSKKTYEITRHFCSCRVTAGKKENVKDAVAPKSHVPLGGTNCADAQSYEDMPHRKTFSGSTLRRLGALKTHCVTVTSTVRSPYRGSTHPGASPCCVRWFGMLFFDSIF